jgi:hypothetical protein
MVERVETMLAPKEDLLRAEVPPTAEGKGEI